MDILQIISAAGIGGIIGSLLTSFVQAWLSHKSLMNKRKFQEKKEAFIGTISAFQKTCINDGKEEVLEFALWVDRCELVANPELTEQLNKMKTGDFTSQRTAYAEVKALMKKDLGF